MNYSVSPPGSPHASMPLLPQEPVTDEAEKDLPGSICGMGAAQGTLVAVGDGLARKVLHQDARMAEAPGDDDDDDDDDIDDVFYEMDGTPEDIAGLDGNVSSEKDEDAALHNPGPVRLDSADGHQDVESGNATRAVGRSLDTIEEHPDTTAGTHSEMALFVVDDKGARQRQETENELQQQSSGIHRKVVDYCGSWLPGFITARLPSFLSPADVLPPAKGAAASVPRDPLATGDPAMEYAEDQEMSQGLDAAKSGLLQSVQGLMHQYPTAERIARGIFNLYESADRFANLPPYESPTATSPVFTAPSSSAEAYPPPSSNVVVSKFSTAPVIQHVPIEMDDGKWLIPLPADDLPPLSAAAGDSVEANHAQSASKVAEIATPYLDQAQKLASEVDDRFYKLMDEINRTHGEIAMDQDPDRLNPPDFQVADKLRGWWYNISGGMAALQSTLGKMTGATTIAAAVDMSASVGVPGFGFAANAAAKSGAAYLCVKALREFPKLASDQKMVRMIEDTIRWANPKLEQFKRLVNAEERRNDVGTRINTLQMARLQKISNLGHEMESVSKARAAAIVLRVNKVSLGNGGILTQVLRLAARAKAGFSEFFKRVSAALGGVFKPTADQGRSAAHLLEQEEAKRISATLKSLRSTAPDSLLKIKGLGVEVDAWQRAERAGSSMSYSNAREQFAMGENLVRTLMTSEKPSFGVMTYDGGKVHGGPRAVSSTLASARAIAWYLDAIADLPEGARNQVPGTPKVVRRGDNLLVTDPQLRLAGFLISAPTAYTAAMAGREDAAPSPIITIDDPGSGMPGARDSMQLESVVDTESNTVELRLSFMPRSEAPVYQPLGNERPTIERMKVALHNTGSAPPATSQDYSYWTKEELDARHLELEKQLAQEIVLFNTEQRMLEAADVWENPRFGPRLS